MSSKSPPKPQRIALTSRNFAKYGRNSLQNENSQRANSSRATICTDNSKMERDFVVVVNSLYQGLSWSRNTDAKAYRIINQHKANQIITDFKFFAVSHNIVNPFVYRELCVNNRYCNNATNGNFRVLCNFVYAFSPHSTDLRNLTEVINYRG